VAAVLKQTGARRRRFPRQDFETVIGAVAVLAAAIALWAASAGGKAARAGDGYLLNARFDQVDGLTVGSPVFLAGLRVGSVVRIELAPGSFKPVVTLSVRREIAVPTDSAVLVMSDGVLGGKFLRIEPGAETEAMKPGDRFPTVQDSVIIEVLLQKIIQGAEARRRGEEPPEKPGAPEQKPEAPRDKPDEKKP
jgi:phospholipid/cholesterol/gamma-HCH transport system substrate-binding protein